MKFIGIKRKLLGILFLIQLSTCSNQFVIKKIPYIEEIVLINIGDLNREGVANQLTILNKYQPKVIGIDAYFRKPKHSEDPYLDSVYVAGDSALSRAIRNAPKIVLGIGLIKKDNEVVSVLRCHPIFLPKHVKQGFVEFIDHNDSIVKKCFFETKVKEPNLQDFELSLSMQLARLYDPAMAARALDRENKEEWINFAGNTIMVNKKNESINNSISFSALDVDQLLNEEFDPDLINNKIVIMGYLGKSFGQYSDIDRFWTPNYSTGKYEEMYGLTIHANVCAMILKGNFLE